MPASLKHPFQAVVVRYSGDASAGEWLNIGLVLLSPSNRFMRARFVQSWERVTAVFSEADPVLLRRVVSAIERYCEGYYSGDKEPRAGIEQAFDAVLPREDASFVRSDAISGIAGDPSRMLDDLYEAYVPAFDSRKSRERRSDADVWREVREHLRAKDVLSRLHYKFVEGRHYTLEFEHAWQNGRWKVAKALSFDLLDPEDIGMKAADWTGRISALGLDEDIDVHLIVGLPPSDAPEDVKVAAAHAVALLREQLEATKRAVIVLEDSAGAFAERVAKDILAHEAAE